VLDLMSQGFDTIEKCRFRGGQFERSPLILVELQ
jgi:hypothetical protein